jgi:hypothetical protein
MCCLIGVNIAVVVVDYEVEFAGDPFLVAGDFDLHLDCAKASSESAK